MSDIINSVTSAPDAFTSWDKCMDKAYCKWPAIVGIVIGSIILLSFLACVINCVCCGARLCSCCCGGCGSCCGSCCPSGRNKEASKYKDDYSRMPATPYGGYQPQPAPAPMTYGYPPPAAQFATFDEPSRKVNEDSLPAMPSWDTATKRRVEDTSIPADQPQNGDLEMGRLDSQSQRMRGGYNTVPNAPLSPMSPNPQGDYFQNDSTIHQGYHSDLGMQRIDSQSNTRYDGFQSVPLSPPPTYRTDSIAQPSISDKFATGAASPSPADYDRQTSYQHHQPSTYAPSTTYEPAQQDYQQDYQQNYQPYNSQQQYQTRPPSFLTPGRKPVNGSYREV
ncbi:hypothetical protein B0A52_04931 [Exophiala mesophila]|uniref:Uncharacterized protein n=1 Tax=Exophiala mesophila TaxID=212818 RepID=A0A438N6I2_EXOME|nr:hypothetical protein B0A52_04931 [Exophiala mesophila]